MTDCVTCTVPTENTDGICSFCRSYQPPAETTVEAVTTAWLRAIEADDECIETDVVVARFIATDTTRLWSLTDVLHRFRLETDLTDVADAVLSLVGSGYLTELVLVTCTEHRDETWDGGCADPRCGDSLFTVNTAETL